MNEKMLPLSYVYSLLHLPAHYMILFVLSAFSVRILFLIHLEPIIVPDQ